MSPQVIKFCFSFQNRIWQRDYRDRPLMQADPGYIPLMTPTMDYPENAANAVATKFVRTAMNKMKCPVFSITVLVKSLQLKFFENEDYKVQHTCKKKIKYKACNCYSFKESCTNHNLPSNNF